MPTNRAARWHGLPKQLSNRGKMVVLFCRHIQVVGNPCVEGKAHQPAGGADEVNTTQRVLRGSPRCTRTFTSKGRQCTGAKFAHPAVKIVAIKGLNISVNSSHKTDPTLPFASTKYKVHPVGGAILATRRDSVHQFSPSSLPSIGECATKAFMEKDEERTETSRREGSSCMTAR